MGHTFDDELPLMGIGGTANISASKRVKYFGKSFPETLESFFNKLCLKACKHCFGKVRTLKDGIDIL